MTRIFKVFGLAVGAVLLLLVVAAIAVSLLFDPNDYKGEITAAVQDATGRQLTLDGDLELAVFPTIRIAVGSATLSNAGEAQGRATDARHWLSGTIAAPSVLPDFSAIVREQISQEVEEEVEEQKDEVRERVRDRLRGLLER